MWMHEIKLDFSRSFPVPGKISLSVIYQPWMHTFAHYFTKCTQGHAELTGIWIQEIKLHQDLDLFQVFPSTWKKHIVSNLSAMHAYFCTLINFTKYTPGPAEGD